MDETEVPQLRDMQDRTISPAFGEGDYEFSARDLEAIPISPREIR